MELKVFTNNESVYRYLEEKRENAAWVAGHALEVIGLCRSYVEDGWRLAVDPLAGYFSRPNPFHTIFLREGTKGQCSAKDLNRLDRALAQWELYDPVLPMTPELERGYGAMDCSLAVNTFEALKKTPEFYNCI